MIIGNRAPTPIYWGANWREIWNDAKSRKEFQRTVGGEQYGFVEDAWPSYRAEYTVHGFNYDAVANSVDFNHQLMTAVVGAGTWTTLNTLHGGLEMATGNNINDSCIMETGDGANPAHPYNVTQDPFFRAAFAVPSVADVLIRIGLYQDANNWAGFQLNTGTDANFHFRTVNGAAATDTSLGAADTDWHEIHMSLDAARAWLSLDGATAVAHTTNIPVDDLLVFFYVETLVGAATKSLRLRNAMVLQDVP